jgi:hypothetical protein
VAETVWLEFYVPDLTPAPPLYAPGVNTEDIVEVTQTLGN